VKGGFMRDGFRKQLGYEKMRGVLYNLWNLVDEIFKKFELFF
jgi:hypothetical protein